MSAPRRLIVLRGSGEQTARHARVLIERLARDAVLWVGGDEVEAVTSAPNAVARLLGQAFDAVVIDAHGGLDADVLGQCHGFVRGGGALVLRLDAITSVSRDDVQRARLVVFPFTLDDVGRRFHARFERVLAAAGFAETASDGDTIAALTSPTHETVGSDEQARVISALRDAFVGPPGATVALLADWGRGKSSALGLALHGLAARVAVTAESQDAAAEIFRFAGPDVAFVPVSALIAPDAADYDVIVVDEAARLPVPLLNRIVERHPSAPLAFATTVRGYEGTGRGFALRFLTALSRRRAVANLSLSAPIRWADGCPLERFVFDALLLDAEPAPVDHAALATCELLDRDALVRPRGATDLRDLFGLLVHAHYRTTPGDLVRVLDAPNLELRVARADRIVAATLLAHEGGFDAALTEAVASGRTRIRAHAIPDALVAHMGHPEAGAMRFVRSVRIATHPGLRRQGLASELVRHVHDTLAADVDAIGTLFGATAELIAFRRTLGYEVVRLSASRGTRTGEPSVLMLRPISERAIALCHTLRQELARDLDIQLTLLQADGELLLDPALEAALRAGLPPIEPVDDATAAGLVRGYAFGSRTIESVAAAISRYVDVHADRVAALDPIARTLVTRRVRDRRSWTVVMAESGLTSHAAAMRALRRAFRQLVLSE